MERLANRRRFLQLTGTGTAVSIAGCTQFGSSDEDPDEEAISAEEPSDDSEPDEGSPEDAEPDEEPDIDPADGIAAVVEPEEEDLIALQEEIMEEVESGDLAEEEAQLEMQARQAELVAEVATEFQSRAEDLDDLTIEGAILDVGLFLLDATDEALIDALSTEEVDMLLPGIRFQEFQEQ